MLSLKTLLWGICLTGCDTKYIDGTLKLNSATTEQFMFKFSFSPNKLGEIQGNFTAIGKEYFGHQPHKLQLCLYNQEKWSKVVQMISKGSLCIERVALANWRTAVVPHYDDEKDHSHFSFKGRVQLPSDKTKYWYAMAVDCFLEEYDAHPPPLHYAITVLNGGDHLPADEDGMTTLHTFVLILLVVFFGLYLLQLQRQWSKMGQSHLIVLLLGLAIFFQISSEFCELCHLSKYKADGKGYRWRYSWIPFDFGAEVMQQMSELTISFMLISLAFGWTLIDKSETEVIGLGTTLAKLNKYFKGGVSTPVVFAVGQALAQLILEILGRKFDEDFNQFHDHEHWPGFLLMLLRVLLCVLFNTAILKLCAATHDQALKGFLRFLQVFGSVWYLAFPAVVMLAALFPPYKRHAVVTGGAITIQSLALISLQFLFLQEGEYFKISSLSKMGGVFGGSNIGSAPKSSGNSVIKQVMKKVATD